MSRCIACDALRAELSPLECLLFGASAADAARDTGKPFSNDGAGLLCDAHLEEATILLADLPERIECAFASRSRS